MAKPIHADRQFMTAQPSIHNKKTEAFAASAFCIVYSANPKNLCIPMNIPFAYAEGSVDMR